MVNEDMSRKVFSLAVIAAILALAALSVTNVALAKPEEFSKFWIKIEVVGPDGKQLILNRTIAEKYYNIIELLAIYYDTVKGWDCPVALVHWKAGSPDANKTWDDEGRLWVDWLPEFKLGGTKKYTEVPEDMKIHTFNASIFAKVKIGDFEKWFLLNWTKDVSGEGVSWSGGDKVIDEIDNDNEEGTGYDYVNGTVKAVHMRVLKMVAKTDLDGDGSFTDDLYFRDPENEDAVDYPKYKIFWNNTNILKENEVVMLAELEPYNVSVGPEAYFNISDTWVELSVEAECWIVNRSESTILTIEPYWRLWKNPEEYLEVKVGNGSVVIMNYTEGKITIEDISAKEVAAEKFSVDLDPVSEVIIPSHTILLRVQLKTFAGQVIDTGEYNLWKVFIQTTLPIDGENASVILRSGWPIPRMRKEGGVEEPLGLAPARGKEYGEAVWFWIPHVSAIYKDVPITVQVEYLTVQVYTHEVNTLDLEKLAAGASSSKTIKVGKGVDAKEVEIFRVVREAGKAWTITAYPTVVATVVEIKDSQPTAQPLVGVLASLESAYGDPILAISDYDSELKSAFLTLPPFDVFKASVGPSGPVIGPEGPRITIDSVYFPGGLLPVPFSYINRPDLTYNYRISLEWALPTTLKWMNVTPEDKTIELNLTRYILTLIEEYKDKATLSEVIEAIAKDRTKYYDGFVPHPFRALVYEAKFRLVDLCDRPITADDYPGATALIYYVEKKEGKEVLVGGVPTGVGKDGTVSIGHVPGGRFKIRLVWKGITLRANIEKEEEPIIDVTRNVYRAPVLKFPIADVPIRVTLWDIDNPLSGVAVKVKYVRDGKVKYEEWVNATGCKGNLTLKKVPLRPANYTEYKYEIVLEFYTTKDMRFLRPEDADLLIGNYTLKFEELFNKYKEVGLEDCKIKYEWVFPLWVYSFKLTAVDHAGEVLEEVVTDAGKYPVVVVLKGDKYGKAPKQIDCDHIACRACMLNIDVDFRLVNVTGTKDQPGGEEGIRGGVDTDGDGLYEAVFKITSLQYDKEKDFTNTGYPHLFVAGGNYTFMVYHGGVLVYNYTVTLPKPFENVVISYDEKEGEVKVEEGAELKYELDMKKFKELAHPIARFTGSKSWPEGGKQYDSKLELVTWTTAFDVYPLSNAGDFLIPKLNLTIIRGDVVDWVPLEDKLEKYDEEKKEDVFKQFYGSLILDKGNLTNLKFIDVAFNDTVDLDGDGIIVAKVPVWTPSVKYKDLGLPVGFGTKIDKVYLLAGRRWGTPSTIDTPYNSAYDYKTHKIFGYVVNYNHTAKEVVVDPVMGAISTFYPKWYKLYNGKWYGWRVVEDNATEFGGMDWNLTYWSGAAKVVHTLAMDGFCLVVYGKNTAGEKVPLAGQLAYMVVKNETEDMVISEEPRVSGDDGVILFYPLKAMETPTPVGTKQVAKDTVVFKFGATMKPKAKRMTYLAKISQASKEVVEAVKKYGLKLEDVIKPDYIEVEVPGKGKYFKEEHNIPGAKHGKVDKKKCIEVEWKTIMLTVLDWSGKPLKNAMVAAFKRRPEAKAMPSIFTFTDDRGVAVLHVPKGVGYEIRVFWRDSYLLEKAGKIPRSVDIYSSWADEEIPRLFGVGKDLSPGGTIKTYVYVGLIKLLDVEGRPLSLADINKYITVEITWPDGTVTKHVPGIDGTVKVILNKDTVEKWPFDASAAYSPDSPHPQSPPGDYKVVVKWSGIEKPLAERMFTIHRGKREVPEIIWEIPIDIRAVNLVVKTPFGTPMESASVKIKLPYLKEAIERHVGKDGVIRLANVPNLAEIEVTVEKWKGMDVGVTKKVTPEQPVVVVDKIGKLRVEVKGGRGQGIGGAEVAITPGNIVGTTNAAGIFEIELPEGKYTITVSKGGKTAEAEVEVKGAEVATAELKLDIFAVVAGWEMSTTEFFGLVIGIIILIIIVFLIAHEYSVWRRKRIARAIVPAKPGE